MYWRAYQSITRHNGARWQVNSNICTKDYRCASKVTYLDIAYKFIPWRTSKSCSSTRQILKTHISVSNQLQRAHCERRTHRAVLCPSSGYRVLLCSLDWEQSESTHKQSNRETKTHANMQTCMRCRRIITSIQKLGSYEVGNGKKVFQSR